MRGRSALVALLALLALLASPGTSVAAAPSGGVRTSAARRWLQKRGGAIDDAIVIPFDDAAHHALDDDVDARAAEWKKNHTAPPPSPLAPPAKNPSDGPVGARVETCKPRAVAKAKRCHYVRHNPACSKDENIVPYLTIHYCHMRRLATLSTALQLSLAVFFISVMAIVAERFFVPSLENVSRALRLPEDVAGATARSVHWSPYDRVGVVLSFGNGAPDVFTQVAAFKGADAEGVSLALGAVFGAGFYVCAVVLPAVVLLTGKKPEAKSPSTIAAATRGKGIRRGLLGGGGDDDDDASDAYDDDDDDETDETDETLTLTRRRGAFHRIAECMSLNHGVDVGKAAFTRDVGFYGAAVATTFGIFLAGDVNAPHAIALGSMYAAYLIALLAPARVRAMLRGLGWGVAPGAAAAFSAEDDLAAAADGEGLTAGLLDADESFEDGYAALIEDGTGVGGAPNVRWGGGGAGSTNGGAGIDENGAFSLHWFPYDRVGVVNVDP